MARVSKSVQPASAEKAPAKAKKIVPEKSVEASLWESANKLRGSVEPAEYKHVVLSLFS